MTIISLPELSNPLVIVLTLAGEGIGESFQGKRMIADTIYNYAHRHNLTIRQSCLLRKPDRYSCWQDPDKLIAKTASFKTATQPWKDCMRLARALNTGEYNPSSVCTHYLNPKLVKKMPAWTKKMQLIGDVGNHRFWTELQ